MNKPPLRVIVLFCAILLIAYHLNTSSFGYSHCRELGGGEWSCVFNPGGPAKLRSAADAKRQTASAPPAAAAAPPAPAAPITEGDLLACNRRARPDDYFTKAETEKREREQSARDLAEAKAHGNNVQIHVSDMYVGQRGWTQAWLDSVDGKLFVNVYQDVVQIRDEKYSLEIMRVDQGVLVGCDASTLLYRYDDGAHLIRLPVLGKLPVRRAADREFNR